MTDSRLVVVPLPRALEGYEPQLKAFFDAMVYKLARNAHKGKWEGATIRDMIQRGREELDELEEAVRGGNTLDIILESADAANFAMMAASVAIRGDGGGS